MHDPSYPSVYYRFTGSSVKVSLGRSEPEMELTPGGAISLGLVTLRLWHRRNRFSRPRGFRLLDGKPAAEYCLEVRFKGKSRTTIELWDQGRRAVSAGEGDGEYAIDWAPART